MLALPNTASSVEWHFLHVVEKPSVVQIDVHVGAAPVVFGHVGMSELPLELPPPLELELLNPDMRGPPELLDPLAPPPLLLSAPPELPDVLEPPELEPPELEPPNGLTALPELEPPNALTPELPEPGPELNPLPRTSTPELPICSTPLELEPLAPGLPPLSEPGSSAPPSIAGPTYSQAPLHAKVAELTAIIIAPPIGNAVRLGPAALTRIS